MDFDSSDNSNAHLSGKIKTQTFKQLQLERFLKEGKVIPASKLAASKGQELQRAKEFEASVEDEQRYRSKTKPRPGKMPDNPPLTRERFEE
jgi:hypothetical protein